MDKKQINHDIFDIGIPSFLETLFTTFASIIDSKMVSAMGVSAISAISVTNQPRLFIFSVFFAINTVTSSLVARYVGKEDRDSANRIFDTALKIVVLLSILFGALSVLLARPIMVVFAGQKDTMDASVLYFRILMGGMIFNVIFMTVNAALRGCGKTRLTLASNVVSCIVNIIFNYLLIEGNLGFPRLAYAGAAIATVMGNLAAMVFVLRSALKDEIFVNITYCVRKHFHLTKSSLLEVGGLAKSTITDSIAMRLSLLVISGIAARIGSYQLAVYSIGMHLLNVNMALGTGLQTAAVALVGRSFGAGDAGLMEAYKKQCERIGGIAAAILSVMIMSTGRWFYGFFSDDKAFIHMGAISCIFIGVITLSQTLKFVYSGYLQGVGAMHEVMVASIVSFAGVNVCTLAVFVLVLKVGIWGVWLSALLSQCTQTVMLWRYIRKRNSSSL